jgi:hypothetical protein
MADLTTTEGKDEAIASTTSRLDQLKERIDQLRVQADLAKLDARDVATKQLNIAQNSCLAAEAKLREAAHDLTATAQAVRDGVTQMIRDAKNAIDAAEKVISRA